MDNTLFIINQTSPITYVTTDNSPFLIVHGNKDTVLPFSQSEMFSAKLTEKKVIVKSIVIEESNHSLETKKVKGIDTEAYCGELIKLFDLHLRNIE